MKKRVWNSVVRRLGAAVCAFSLVCPSAVFAGSTGWQKRGEIWSYYEKEGSKALGWRKIQDQWYYFDPSKGEMKTGWFQDAGGGWYFLSPAEGSENGRMLSGWQWIDGYCYYLGTPDSGRMFASGKTPDGFSVNEDGRWTDEQGRVQFIEGKGFMTKENPGKGARAGTGGSGSKSGGSSGGRKKDSPSEGGGAGKTPQGDTGSGRSDEEEVPKPRDGDQGLKPGEERKDPPGSHSDEGSITPEDLPEQKQEGFVTLADYAKSNILSVKKTEEDNLAAIQEKAYRLLHTTEERQNLYFLELADRVIIVDLNDRLLGKESGGSAPDLEEKIYLSTQDNLLEEASEESLQDMQGRKRLLLISGSHTRNFLPAAEYTLGLPGSRYNGSLVVSDLSREVAGIDFISEASRVSRGANGAMISLKSETDDFSCSIDHNGFYFSEGDTRTELYRAIGIYSLTGRLEISDNIFEGQNKKNGIGTSNSHAAIDCQARSRGGKKHSSIFIRDNHFTDLYSAGIILYASEKEAVHIENNLFAGTGEEAIKLTPAVTEYPQEHDILIRGNTIRRYGLNENTGYTEGGFGGLGPVNTGEFGIHLSFYGGTQRGSKVNGAWHSSAEQLGRRLKDENTISPKEENDANAGVVDSAQVLIGQKGLYIDTASVINRSESTLLRDKSLVIVKDQNGDLIYGQDPENMSAEIRVKDLYICGEGAGVVTLPSTLHIIGDLRVDLPNGFVKTEARVDQDSTINAGRVKSSALFTVLSEEPIPRGAAEKDFEVRISQIRDDEGRELEDPKLRLSVVLGRRELRESEFEYADGIVRIRKELINALEKNERLLIRISAPDQNLSTVSSAPILIEISNLSSASFAYSSKSFSHLDAEEEISIRVSDVKNQKGEPVDPADTRLEGNVEFLIFGQVQDKSLLFVDDASDTIRISKELLNYLYATRYEASPERNANFGTAQSYEIRINDPSHHIYEIRDKVSFEVIDRSGADFVFEKGMTFTQGQAPEEGITLSVRDVVNTRGERVDSSKTRLQDADGNLNMNVEPFPVHRNNTEDSEIIVIRDEEGNYLREVFNPKYIRIDDEKDTITFTKEYLDKIHPGRDSSTENGIKTFVFKYTDTSAKVDVRSQKVALHIKLKEKSLSQDTAISFREGTYRIEGNRILGTKGADPDSLMLAGFLKHVIRQNPRQRIIASREGKTLRAFDALYRGDQIRVIAEDGVSEAVYIFDIETKYGEKLYKSFDEALIGEFAESFVMVRNEGAVSIRRLLEAIVLEENASARVLSLDNGGREYEPVIDSTLTKDMVLVLRRGDREQRFMIRFSDGTQYRALLIGNQNYGNPKANLAGPENDIKIMDSLFKRASFGGKSFERIQTERDLNKEAFLEKIAQAFAGATDEDVSYLYYSGHGYHIKSRDTSYICTVDAIPERSGEEDSAKHWISVDELKLALDQIPGTKVVILDCCNAGGFIGKEFTDATSGATPRMNVAEEAESFVDSAAMLFGSANGDKSYLTDSEYKVLVASSSNEYSYEDKKKAIGKFTVEFVKGAQEGLADQDKDARISLDEMYTYLMENVESISHIQVFPQKDTFCLLEKVNPAELHSSVLFKIRNSAYSFESRDLGGGKIVGTIKGHLLEINENTTASEFLQNIEKEHESQSISIESQNGTEYAPEEKLRKADTYLKVAAESGKIGRFPVIVDRVISDDQQKSVVIEGVPAKGITVSIDESASLYAIALDRPMTAIEFVSAIRTANLSPMKYYKLFGKDGAEKKMDRNTYVVSLDRLEVSSPDKTVKQLYNITVNSEVGDELEGDYKVENNVIRSGGRKLTNKTKVSELLDWLRKNRFDLDSDRMSGIYPAGMMPPFGRKKAGNQTLAEGDRLIIRDFMGYTKQIYTIELAKDLPETEKPDREKEAEFDALQPDFGTALGLEGDVIRSGSLKLTPDTKTEEVLGVWANKEAMADLIDSEKSGIYKGAAQIIGGEPSKPARSGEETIGYGDRLIIFGKGKSGKYKVYRLELEEEGGGEDPIVIPPIIIGSKEDFESAADSVQNPEANEVSPSLLGTKKEPAGEEVHAGAEASAGEQKPAGEQAAIGEQAPTGEEALAGKETFTGEERADRQEDSEEELFEDLEIDATQ